MNDTTTLTRPTTMMVQNLKPMSAGAQTGFIDVTLPSGMVLHHCSIFRKDDRTWVSPPSKQIIGRDGTVQRTQDGKARYEQVVSFVDRTTHERWSNAIVAALRLAHPEVLL